MDSLFNRPSGNKNIKQEFGQRTLRRSIEIENLPTAGGFALQIISYSVMAACVTGLGYTGYRQYQNNQIIPQAVTIDFDPGLKDRPVDATDYTKALEPVFFTKTSPKIKAEIPTSAQKSIQENFGGLKEKAVRPDNELAPLAPIETTLSQLRLNIQDSAFSVPSIRKVEFAFPVKDTLQLDNN